MTTATDATVWFPPTQARRDDALSEATTTDRLLLAALLVGAAVLYLANITANGNANTFYAGAAWAGSRNWEALLFGSVDPANFITVDKPPLSQWVMGLSGQIFGYSSASMLIPEALMGVAAVALLYAATARISGRRAGLLAGAALALTPVAAMMFRFNNPDAAMVLLMTAGAYCTVRALGRGARWWLALAGVAIGFAFLTKMLEGLMILPALGVAYLLAAPVSIGRRCRDLVIAAGALVVSAGWYVVLTLLWPASSRPYLAGSTDNNFMNLVLGYNGLDRIAGRQGGQRFGAGQPGDLNAAAGEHGLTHSTTNAFAGTTHGGGFGSATGPTRLFTGEFGAEISFLLPCAIVALIVTLVLRGRRPRTDLVRAGAILFGVWLVVDAVVLSLMNGTVHPYYSLAIAPPIAALVGIGFVESWRARDDAARWRFWTARGGGAAMVAAAGVWAFVLLDREPTWMPWLRWLIVLAAIVTAIGFLLPHRARVSVIALATLAIAATLAAPAAFAVAGDTVSHTGGSPSVIPGHTTGIPGHTTGIPGHTTGFGASHLPAAHRADTANAGSASANTASAIAFQMFGGRTIALGPQLTQMLQSSDATWAAAVDRTGAAAQLELAAKVPVMGIGGFMNDPTPTLAQFTTYVAQGKIGYYLTPRTSADQTAPASHDANATGAAAHFGGAATGSRNSVSTRIDQWVKTHFHSQQIGAYVVYNLRSPVAA